MNKELAMRLWNNKEYFSKGKRGLIYVSRFKTECFVIKVKNPESASANIIKREHENNLLLNRFGVGPKVFYYDSDLDFVVREFVDGPKFSDWVQSITCKKKLKTFFVELLGVCRKMDNALINKLEMNHPSKDLLVVNDLPVIIDFERCKKSLNPKNVTQVCQFFVSGNVKVLLKKFGVVFNKERVLSLAEKYKKSLSNKDNYFKELEKEIGSVF